MPKELNSSNFKLVWKLQDEILIYIRIEDIFKNDPMAIMFNLQCKTVYVFRLQRMLKLATFEAIRPSNEDIQNCHTDRLKKILPREKICDSLMTIQRYR